MSVKIVHCGDIHIGMNGGERSYAVRRRAEVIKTFLNIVAFAEEQRADLLLIAGDLFDNHKIGEETLSRIAEAFSAFSGRIFITPGNHDYYSENSLWSKLSLLQNVTVFKEDKVIVLPDIGVKIFGSPFLGAYKGPLPQFSFKDEADLVSIALIHGDMTADSPYCPITKEKIESIGADYVALGHIHKRSEILKAGKTSYAYCGCPDGQGFDETGEKGFYFGTVEKGLVSLDFIPFESRRFIEERVDISGVSSRTEIPKLILRKIREKHGDRASEWLFKIILTGETSLDFSCGKIREALENEIYFVKIKDKTEAPAENLEKIAAENSIRGVFTEKMLGKRADYADKSLDIAVKLGLRAFFEEVGFDED